MAADNKQILPYMDRVGKTPILYIPYINDEAKEQAKKSMPNCKMGILGLSGHPVDFAIHLQKRKSPSPFYISPEKSDCKNNAGEKLGLIFLGPAKGWYKTYRKLGGTFDESTIEKTLKKHEEYHAWFLQSREAYLLQTEAKLLSEGQLDITTQKSVNEVAADTAALCEMIFLTQDKNFELLEDFRKIRAQDYMLTNSSHHLKILREQIEAAGGVQAFQHVRDMGKQERMDFCGNYALDLLFGKKGEKGVGLYPEKQAHPYQPGR